MSFSGMLTGALINTLHEELRFLTPHLTTTIEEKPLKLHLVPVFSNTIMIKQIRTDDLL